MVIQDWVWVLPDWVLLQRFFSWLLKGSRRASSPGGINTPPEGLRGFTRVSRLFSRKNLRGGLDNPPQERKLHHFKIEKQEFIPKVKVKVLVLQ